MQRKALAALHHLTPVAAGIAWVLIIMVLGSRTNWIQSEAAYFSMLMAMGPAPLILVYAFIKGTRAYWYRAPVIGMLFILATPSTLPLVAISSLSWAFWRAWNRDRTASTGKDIAIVA